MVYTGWGIKRKIGTYRHDDICTLGIIVPINAKGLSDDALDPVPFDRSFQLSADTDADSVVLTAVGEIDKGETFAVQPCALPVNRLKLLGFEQQAGLPLTDALARLLGDQ